jgi:hypothetical protein
MSWTPLRLLSNDSSLAGVPNIVAGLATPQFVTSSPAGRSLVANAARKYGNDLGLAIDVAADG